ncbi:MAG: hypothetical protein H0W94_01985 [Actinobacteria bacterium]|nr:hypothetical protein [Actinomycetota bacterium]
MSALAKASLVVSLVVSAFVSAPALTDGTSARSSGPFSGDAAADAIRTYARLALSFEATRGQASSNVDFLARTEASTLYLTGKRALLSPEGPALGRARP